MNADIALFAATDPIIWRGVERVVIAVGAIAFGYLGYKLYINGITRGTSEVEVKYSFVRFAVSGTGPGLVFMTFGAVVLVTGLSTGGASTNEKIVEEFGKRLAHQQTATESTANAITVLRASLPEEIDKRVSRTFSSTLQSMSATADMFREQGRLIDETLRDLITRIDQLEKQFAEKEQRP